MSPADQNDLNLIRFVLVNYRNGATLGDIDAALMATDRLAARLQRDEMADMVSDADLPFAVGALS